MDRPTNTDVENAVNDIEIDNNDELIVKNMIAQESSAAVRDLKRFLNDASRWITEKGDRSTNIINRIDGRTYCMPESEIEHFFHKAELTRRENIPMHFLERQDENYSGIMIDIDRYQTSKRSEFTEDMFQNLSFHVSRLLVEMLDFTDDMLNDNGRFSINIFYTTKPKPLPARTANDDGLYRDGFHMLIPHVMISRRAKRYLIDQLATQNILEDIFGKLECLETNHSKMLDGNSAHVPVMFYGCSKPGSPAYKLSVAHEVSVNPRGGFFSPMIKLIDIQRYTTDVSLNIMYDLSLSFNLSDVEDFKPQFRRYHIDVKNELIGAINTNAEQHRGEVLPEDTLADARNDISILTLDDPDARYIKTALDILTIDYATDYDKWLNVIIAIASCGERYKPFALHFSMRCPEKYDEAAVLQIWERARSGNWNAEPLTRNSIYFWAKTCNPVRYREMFNTSYYKILRQYVFTDWGRIEDGRVAKLLHHMLRDKFITDEKSNDVRKRYYWYEFVTKDQEQKRGQVYKWREESNPDVLYKYIQQHLPTLYSMVENDVKTELERSEDDRIKKYLKETLKQLRASRIKLNNHNYCKSVIAAAAISFRVRGFCDELDQDGNILGVGNGVLKLGQTATLVEGYHEHRVSMYTDTLYIPFDPNNHYIANTLRIIGQILPEKDVFEYILMFLSTGLDGNPAAPLMLMLDGGGANGKTTLLEWVRSCLGDYGYKAPMNLLTDKREKGSNANSAFIGMKMKRFAEYSEADDEEGDIFINGGRFKEMISPEIQTGRELHKQQENFKITATQAAAFNKRLSFRSNDHAIWRRVRYYKCKVKFCSDPDENNPYEQKEDSRIAEEYPHDPYYRSAMMSILVYYNERLRREYGGNLKRVPCRTIDIETEEYRNTQDTLNLYITQMIVVPGAEPTFEDQMANGVFEYPLNAVLASYKTWFSSVKGKESPEWGIEIFETSRLAKYIRRDINGAQMLVGYRIRGSLDEKLRVGEQFLIDLGNKERGVQPQHHHEADADNITPRVERVREDDEYATLEKRNIGPMIVGRDVNGMILPANGVFEDANADNEYAENIIDSDDDSDNSDDDFI